MQTESTPTPVTGQDYGFDDPADNAIAHSIASKDPVRDLAGPMKITGGSMPNLSAPTLAALPPAMRAPIEQQLAKVAPAGRAAEETRLITEALVRNSASVRVAAGGGEGTDPYWREVLSQEHELGQLRARLNKIDIDLADATFETVYDEVTGKPAPRAVERIQGDRRKALEAEVLHLQAHIADLNGRGGDLRLKKALGEAVTAQKEAQRQLDEEAEAKRRGDDILKEERINARAQTYAKHRRTNI